ncbi:hypothetical protein [Bradyrhizobium sp. AUGA SZCCT0182]|uniref:hypothetical protein n=1 Tax=Bradyrhizobium sp. AUGA SZCCT0182 TaxID=2807667 RepID=UPI001BAB4CA4|nr:hypothetical protein [Bradyrhizobium sp. AUGA SZCCT0182]MBR1236540.1 hypothetical protein [Bradyrhizobium sp. AUGA SZCCT0182]
MRTLTIDPIAAALAQIVFEHTAHLDRPGISRQQYAQKVFAGINELGYTEHVVQDYHDLLIKSSPRLLEEAEPSGFDPKYLSNTLNLSVIKAAFPAASKRK